MQSRKKSFLEASMNTASGFIVSYIAWIYAMPILFGIQTSASKGFGVTVFFTFISIARSYTWRRIFNHTEREINEIHNSNQDRE